jgi:hypothetical protein
MPTTYTTNLRLAKPASGELAGSWGTVVNDNITSMIDEAVGGYVAVTISPVSNNQALTAVNGGTDQARHAVLKLNAGSLSANFNLFAPPTEKFYFVWNNTSFICTFYAATAANGTTAAGTGIAIPANKKALIFLDGTNAIEAHDAVIGNFSIGGSLTLGTQLAVAQGGTGGTTQSTARSGIGAAASGANSDITSLSALSSPLSVAQGGTGVTTSTGSGANALATGPTLVGPIIQPRVVAVADGTSITPNIDTTDIVTQANGQAAGTLTINAPSGSLFNGQKLIIRITSTAVQTFSWNGFYQGSTDLALPTASSGASKTDIMGFIFNSTGGLNKWQLVAKVFGF